MAHHSNISQLHCDHASFTCVITPYYQVFSVSSECTTSGDRVSTVATWLMTSIIQWPSARHANGIAGILRNRGICDYFLRRSTSILSPSTYRIPYPKPKEKKYIAVMTSRYTKLAKDIPTFKTTATGTAIIFIEYWVASFETPSTLLTNNESSFNFQNSFPHSVGSWA